MVIDGLRGYLQLANGLTDVTRARAQAAAKTLLAQGESSVGAVLPESVRTQVSSLTDDLLATSRANRDLLVHLVRSEVERSVTRLGLVSAHEFDAASRRVNALERRVEELAKERPGARPRPRKAAKKSAAKKRAAKPAMATEPAPTVAAPTAAAPTVAAPTVPAPTVPAATVPTARVPAATEPTTA